MELRVFAEPQEGASYEQQLAVAQLAERLGFGAFFRSDHFLQTKPADPLPGPTDSWVTLGALARETNTIQLGTLVTSATFRLPGPLAVAVAQVDAMSGGRVELGLGSGWFEPEHEAYGIPFPSLAERFDRLEEQFAILTGMWATAPGERFSFDGKHYSLHDCPALPRPVRAGGPPLIVGGLGARRTPSLAARYAAEFNVPFSTSSGPGSSSRTRARPASRTTAIPPRWPTPTRSRSAARRARASCAAAPSGSASTSRRCDAVAPRAVLPRSSSAWPTMPRPARSAPTCRRSISTTSISSS